MLKQISSLVEFADCLSRGLEVEGRNRSRVDQLLLLLSLFFALAVLLFQYLLRKFETCELRLHVIAPDIHHRHRVLLRDLPRNSCQSANEQEVRGPKRTSQMSCQFGFDRTKMHSALRESEIEHVKRFLYVLPGKWFRNHPEGDERMDRTRRKDRKLPDLTSAAMEVAGLGVDCPGPFPMPQSGSCGVVFFQSSFFL